MAQAAAQEGRAQGDGGTLRRARVCVYVLTRLQGRYERPEDMAREQARKDAQAQAEAQFERQQQSATPSSGAQ